MIRFGIVGAGGIAKKFARDIALVDDAIVTSVASSTKEKAEKYKKEYNVPYAFSSYEEMSKSDKIDAVYIATPHSFHHDQAIMFMKHGKHVLIEKPIAVNSKQYDEMVIVAKENKVMMMEAMWTHFLPSTRFVKGLVDQGDFGKLVEAYIDFGYSLLDDYPEEKRLLNPDLAGGSILDIGVYPISFYQLISKSEMKDLDVTFEMTYTGVDSACNIEILEEGGAEIHIRSSIKDQLPNNAELIFEKGKIMMIDFSRSQEVFVNESRFPIPFEGEGFVHEITAFVNDIEKGYQEDKIRNHKAAGETVKLMDKVRAIIGLKFPFE